MESSELESPPVAAPAPMALRVAAGVAGAAIAIAAVVFTAGVALVALAGVGVAWWLARRRGRPLTRQACGLGAVAGATLGFALAVGGVAAFIPSGTFDRLQQSFAQSQAAARTQPPPTAPEWMGRISPEAARTSAAQQQQVAAMTDSPGFLYGVLGFTVLIVGVIVGGGAALGSWLAALLLRFAARGAGLPGRKVAPVPPPPPRFRPAVP